MKIVPNKKYNTIALYAFLVIAANVLLVVAVFKFSSILKVAEIVISSLTPVIWGLVIAFLMNPIMVKFENLFKNKVIKNPSKKKFTRACSVTISSIVFLGIVIGCLSIVLPELIKSVMEIFNNASSIAANVQTWIDKLFKNYPEYANRASAALKNFSTDFDSLINRIQPMLQNILSGAWGVVTLVKNFALGFIVSIYMLCSKETLIAQVKKLVISFCSKRTSKNILTVSAQANKIFSGFLTGKIIDSLIIGLLCFIGLTIMNMPYNIMISVIVGVTNIIPFFGPIIGAVPSALLILLIEPKKVILLLIFILCLQQFDGNILGPKILGDSTGLPGFWVMVSLFICGGLFGFVGMVIAVPLFALLYALTRRSVQIRLKKKNLPLSTEYYMHDDNAMGVSQVRHRPLTPDDLDDIVVSIENEAENTDNKAGEINHDKDEK